MATPANRIPIRIARGTYADLAASIADIAEGEVCWATDENQLYVKESGSLVASSADLSSLDASNLTSGTIPDARFPATLPTTSGANLTSLNASELASGTVPDARFPATLPTASGANLTSLNASNLSTGTLPDARFPATLPTASGANLTSLNASNLSSGTVATARLGSGSASSATFLRGDQTWAAPAGGGAWEFITSATGSSASSIAITSGIDSTYDRYALTFHFVPSAAPYSGVTLYSRYSSNGGSSWLSGTYYSSNLYTDQSFGGSGSSGYVGRWSTSNKTFIDLVNLRADSAGYYAGTVYLSKPFVPSKNYSLWHALSSDIGSFFSVRSVGAYSSNITVNAIQFYPSSGTITGTVRLYGIKNS